ncbi:hypothetical protein BaRGS_00010393 [Batillaria attramentaria]|uniref:Uncharacterized protein n=1 Tax=Batillaria attramentaria TaxID=370345 RepID=A0ABD0LG38_9CAEN
MYKTLVRPPALNLSYLAGRTEHFLYFVAIPLFLQDETNFQKMRIASAWGVPLPVQLCPAIMSVGGGPAPLGKRKTSTQDLETSIVTTDMLHHPNLSSSLRSYPPEELVTLTRSPLGQQTPFPTARPTRRSGEGGGDSDTGAWGAVLV